MRHREDGHQIALMNWARVARVGDIRVIDHLIHIRNEGQRSAAEGKRAKSMGMRPGVSDLFLAYPAHGLAGLWIELKAPAAPGFKGGVPTQNQLDWLESRAAVGYGAQLCFGWEAAKTAIINYLGGGDGVRSV